MTKADHPYYECCREKTIAALASLVRHTDAYRSERLTVDTIIRNLPVARAAAYADGHSDDAHDDDYIVGKVEMMFTIFQEEAARLIGRDIEHRSWLPSKKAALFTRAGYWDNYRRLLEQRLAPEPQKRLDEVTDQILDSLEDPSKVGQWDRRGLVVGQVQSGKTANYLGLICKAIDAGYKMIIVLAGIHNNLRAQTQFRIDEGLIGRDTRLGAGATTAIGVGLEREHGTVISLTSATESGDFKTGTAISVGFNFSTLEHPTVFVVKKHVTVLETLHDWMQANAHKPEGHARIAGVPLLMIDDEADFASLDTTPTDADQDIDPTATNKAIRRLLNGFDQSSFVGYTATPFANVFIDDSADHPEFGEDLFPRDFIFALQPPSSYIGPERVFGIDLTEDGAEHPSLPLVNYVDDAEEWMPPSHGADLVVEPDLFPASLKRAICSFILSNAAKQIRGMGRSHKSMLIHVTPFVKPQQQVRQQVADYIYSVKNEIFYNDNPNSQMLAYLRSIWETDFLNATASLASILDEQPPVHAFDEVRPELANAVGAIQVRMVNGSSSDALDYYEYADQGLSTIVIGGAKLSRGLTLEGLSVSYYLRATRMYDTLMQMGRWFGYRTGYLDLCRVYTTSEIAEWYRYIAIATRELLDDFQIMQAQNATPREFGLRVRHSPGMLVTSQTKMRRSRLVRISFSQERPEVTSMEISPSRRELNLGELEAFISRLREVHGEPTPEKSGDWAWRNVGSNEVINYYRSLADLQLNSRSRSASPGPIADYIQARSVDGGLTNWTVLLKSNSLDPEPRSAIAGLKVGLATRAQNGSTNFDTYSIKSLIGSQDEGFDLTDAERDEALDLAKDSNSQTVYGRHFRCVRPSTNGLLVIYLLKGTDIKNGRHIPLGPPFVAYCVSFPTDPTGAVVEYRVNAIFESSESNGSSGVG